MNHSLEKKILLKNSLTINSTLRNLRKTVITNCILDHPYHILWPKLTLWPCDLGHMMTKTHQQFVNFSPLLKILFNILYSWYKWGLSPVIKGLLFFSRFNPFEFNCIISPLSKVDTGETGIGRFNSSLTLPLISHVNLTTKKKKKTFKLTELHFLHL